MKNLKGGTFTISNQGGIGGAQFTPIINKPEVAILGLGKGAMKAVVRDNNIQPRMMLPLGLSYDHRVIDGGTAARFIVDLVKAIEGFEESGGRKFIIVLVMLLVPHADFDVCLNLQSRTRTKEINLWIQLKRKL